VKFALHFIVVALCTMFICTTRMIAQNVSWTLTSAPSEVWVSIASSSDGTVIVAIANDGIYMSVDSGAAWAQTSAPSLDWISIALSSDGTDMAAAVGGGGIYISTHSGSTWTQTSAPSENWGVITSSADGTALAAVVGDGGIYISTNSGVAWTQTSAPSENWFSMASSADGTKLAVVNDGGGIYTSTNSGAMWTQTSAPNEYWQSIASSSDETKLAAVVYYNKIYASTNSGGTWIQTSAPNEDWQAITSSFDGTKLAAVAYDGGIYTSTNSGFTWAMTTVPNEYWQLIASSSDGTKLVAAIDGGGIFTGIALPSIVTQPLSQNVCTGSNVTFVIATSGGNPPLSYQWQFNGMDISNATNTSLSLTGVTTNNSGNYFVVVTNSGGSVTSSVAVLTVLFPPLITLQPVNQIVFSGSEATFNMAAGGSYPEFYQWEFNGTNILRATNFIYSIPSAGTNISGIYSVLVTNAVGSAMSSNVALSVVLSPASRTNYAGSTATFSAPTFSPESLNFQWQQNGTNLVNGNNISGATNSVLTIANVQDVDAGVYRTIVSDAFTNLTTSNAVLTVNDLPFIATQPQSQTVLAGNTVIFSSTAYGASPLVLQWYFNGAPVGLPIGGTNFTTYTLSNVSSNQTGNYTVQAVNGYGSVMSSNATLTVIYPPVITAQPVDRTNAANSTVTFSVTVSSLSAVNYQWKQNDTNLVNGGKFSGVTNNSLTITGVSSNEAAIYSVTVTNVAGNVTSSNATLTVIYPPIITTQPVGQRLVMGNGVSFNVVLSGTAPFNYQWCFNAGNLLNATNAVYAIQAIGTNNTGNYSVVVTNLAGGVTSSNALLTVLVPPSLVLQLWAGYPVLNLNGMLSNNFVVQYNADLTSTNWINLLTLSNLLTSPYEFLDPAGNDQPTRFYRVLMQ